MIAACLHLGYTIDDYLTPDHPLQQTILDLMAEFCAVPRGTIHLATDGCSLPTFGTTLHAFARAYAALSTPRSHDDAVVRLRAAMVAHPENVAGPGTFNTDLMQVAGDVLFAKSGAEGLICIGVPSHGLGIAIRIADGDFRAHPVVAGEVLRQLGVLSDSALDRLRQLHDPIIYNHNRRVVGEIRPAFTLDA
jgi:L-asparaginase II